MLDAPLDGLLGWSGLALVSVVVAGVAVSLPAASPPAAGPVADSVDRVATSSHRATASVPLRADAIRIGTERISLRDGRATSHATLATADPVYAGGGALRAVLGGDSPSRAFESRRAFAAAVEAARDRAGDWRAAPARLRVRRVTWGEVDATLVG